MKVSSAIPYLVGGVLGSSLVVTCQIAWADPTEDNYLTAQLVAQQVVDGLPPPPPVDFGQQETLPSIPVNQTTIPGSSGQSSVQAPALTPPSVAQQYLVVVNGDSPLLLSQVQAVVSDASVLDYNGQRFIQAGLFNDVATAQQQVAVLASQGIGAQVVSVSPVATSPAQAAPMQQAQPAQPSQQAILPAMPPPEMLPVAPASREVEFGQSPEPTQLNNPSPPEAVAATAPLEDPRSFYVVIPGGADDLNAITNQIVRLGDGFGISQMVQAHESPRGPHVRVGPFIDRNSANRWSSYFRDFGMDARVYYTQ